MSEAVTPRDLRRWEQELDRPSSRRPHFLYREFQDVILHKKSSFEAIFCAKPLPILQPQFRNNQIAKWAKVALRGFRTT